SLSGSEVGHLLTRRSGTGGSFDSTSTYDLPTPWPILMATADLGRNGHPQVLVASWVRGRFVPDSPGRLSQFVTQADGSLDARRDFDVWVDPSAIAVGDFNGDSWPDVAVLSQVSGNGYTAAISLFPDS